MALRDAAVLALPVVTGLNGLIWAEAVDKAGAVVATACGAVAYIFVALAMSSGLPTLASGAIPLLLALVALNSLTSWLWLVPIVGGTRYVSLALIEGAWPVFSILFGYLLFGRRELDLTSGLGGALILVGAALVFHKA